MDFKELYQEWLDQNNGLRGAIKESYDSFNRDNDYDSITTQVVTEPFLKPGMLYVFDYIDLQLIDQVSTTDTVPFFDGHPYIMALDHDKEFQYGLNLNCLPMEARYMLWTNMYRVFENEIFDNTRQQYNKWKEFKRLSRDTIKNLITLKSDIAINKYDITLMRKIRAIEWECVIPACTLYMKYNMIFNKRKSMDTRTIWKAAF